MSSSALVTLVCQENTVTSHNPTPSSGDGGFNEFRNIGQVSSDLLNVYLNGVLLDDSDYTSDPTTNSGTVTIGGATLTANDVVVIQVIGALDNSNFVPVGGGTFTGDVSFGDNNITNVGSIALDSISADATSITISSDMETATNKKIKQKEPSCKVQHIKH